MHGNNPNKLRRVTTCGVLALILAVIVAVILVTTVYSGIEYFIQNKDVLLNGDI